MNFVAIDNTVTDQRKTKWTFSCPNCQNERSVTYSQKCNILNGKSNANCRTCRIELGIQKIVTGNLTGGSAKGSVRNRKSTNQIFYITLFETLEQKELRKLNQRKAKLGKTGKDTNNYIDGRTPINKLLRTSDEYKQLRKFIFKRDDYSCQMCFEKGCRLEMDHIKEWCNYPQLRFEPTNCRTLCVSCHKTTDNYKSKAIRKRTA